jgi:hypothetical protein
MILTFALFPTHKPDRSIINSLTLVLHLMRRQAVDSSAAMANGRPKPLDLETGLSALFLYLSVPLRVHVMAHRTFIVSTLCE